MLPDPREVPDQDFRDKLEAITDLLKAAVEGTTYPPGRDSFDPDVRPPDPIRPITDFSNSAKRLYVFQHDAEFTAYADDARRRSFDPAFRRLANDIDDLVCKLAEKVNPPVQVHGLLGSILKPRGHS